MMAAAIIMLGYALVGIAVVGLLIYFVCERRREKKEEAKKEYWKY